MDRTQPKLTTCNQTFTEDMRDADLSLFLYQIPLRFMAITIDGLHVTSWRPVDRNNKIFLLWEFTAIFMQTL